MKKHKIKRKAACEGIFWDDMFKGLVSKLKIKKIK
jgi:hypothetical protein